jgi:glycosyltransferase involved in cell wall biosynthesis
MRFACAVGDRFDRFVLIARATDDAVATPYELPGGVELAELPHYDSLRQVGRVLLAIPATMRAMWRELGQLDAVWVSGVHPLGLLLCGLAVLRRRRLVLLIRQDSPRYFRSRLPGRGWAPLLLPLRFFDLVFRLVGRRALTTVVGAELAHRYRAPRANVLEMRVTLLDRSQLADGPSDADWSGEIGLLTVGRVEPEKNPGLAIQSLAELDRSDPGRYRLTWAGEGRLVDELRGRAGAAGVADRLVLRGFVPFGPELLALYRGSHAFVHFSLTEGVPAVLYEAMGAGLPIVATDVGGVAEALGGGEAGLLVPPGDREAMVGAIRRLTAEPELRQRIAGEALQLAGAATIESESERVASFISSDRAA